ncbi:Subtilase-type proteinase RRT12 [Spathaspora sp. JA1]|nr:Subtilase-type proteinase RRT12 [Spathaspora sp. JA1]
MIDRLKKCPMISDISTDDVVQMYDIDHQPEAPRHLARVSRKRRMRPGRRYPYVFDDKYLGRGVNAYVIDSGVQINHPEFQNRASSGIDLTGEGSGDVNGHGTHVAGLIGSVTFGVAKNVNLVEIKALNVRGAGSLSNILQAIEFAVNHCKSSGKRGVANLSLGAYKNTILNNMIEEAVKTGLVVVVAAGNSNTNACLTSPASSKYAITVGAIDDYNDSITHFSNWGECVDVFASGYMVSSLNAHDFEKSSVLSGTSMAAPIISGLVANLLSEGIEPQDVKKRIIRMSTKNRIPKSSLFLRKKTANRIAYNGIRDRVLENVQEESDEE